MSDCPKSEAAVGRCMAGAPKQVSIKHPLALLGDQNMAKLDMREDDDVYRCTYCGTVYISVGIRGMERVLGKYDGFSFVPKAL